MRVLHSRTEASECTVQSGIKNFENVTDRQYNIIKTSNASFVNQHIKINELHSNQLGDLYVIGSSPNTSTGGSDAYVASIALDGSIKWAQTYGEAGRSTRFGILYSDEEHTDVISDSEGNIYVTGAGLYDDLYVVKYNRTGEQLWTKILEGEYVNPSGYGGGIGAKSLNIDDDGNIQVFGYSFANELAWGNQEFLRLKLDHNGNLISPLSLFGSDNGDFLSWGFGFGEEFYLSGVSNGDIYPLLNNPSGSNVSITAKFDEDNTLLWLVDHGAWSSIAASDISSDQSITVLTEKEDIFTAQKISGSGEVLWELDLAYYEGHPDKTVTPDSLYVLENDNIIIPGLVYDDINRQSGVFIDVYSEEGVHFFDTLEDPFEIDYVSTSYTSLSTSVQQLNDTTFALSVYAPANGYSGEISEIFFFSINTSPSDIFLSSSSSVLSENIANGSVVATLSSTDEDKDDTHTYSIVTGDGGTDNSAFTIDGDELKIVDSPDFETKSSYSILIETKDIGGLTFQKEFVLSVDDLNEAPTDLSTSASTFDENITGGSAVATLSSTDEDKDDTHRYSLVAGDGDTDNSAFTIDGDELKIVDSPDFETKSSYSVRLQTKDSGGLTFEKSFTLTVNDLNEDPTDLSVSTSTFDENIAGGSVVATLSTSDPDAGDTHTYALVTGTGDADNSAFTIEGTQLRINESPDFETKSSYSIRLQTKDSDGLTFEKAFTLSVNDLNEIHSVESRVLTSEIADQLIAEQGSDIVIPSIYTSIGSLAFASKSITSVFIPSTITSIEGQAFEYTELTSVTIPDSVTSIAGSAFYGSKLRSAKISANIDSIEGFAFANNKLVELELPSGVTSIGPYAFYLNEITTASIPSTVKYIYHNAFTRNSLLEVELPEEAIQKDGNAFDANVHVLKRPYGIYNVPYSIEENLDATVALATLSTHDFNDNHIYSLTSGDGDEDNGAFILDNNNLIIARAPDYETKSEYRIRLQVRDSDGLVYEDSFEIAVNDLNELPADLSVSTSTFDENIAGGSVVATLSTSDPDAGDTHTYSLVTGDGDADNSAFTIEGTQLRINESPDFETKSSYSIRLQTKDSGGLTFEKSLQLIVNDLPDNEVILSIQEGLTGKVGSLVQIPIQIDNASGVESVDLEIAYDQNTFEVPSSNIFEPGELNPGWSFTTNATVPGILNMSAFSETELGSHSGSIAVLNLKIKDDAVLGSSLIDIVTSEINETRIGSTVVDGEVIIEKSTFQILDIRTHSHGLALVLTDAPDMDAFRLYGGKESDSQEPSLVLINSNNDKISLSAHWEEETKQLHLLSLDVLQDGDYTLQIRSGGLVSETGDLLDGNGDGISGDDLAKQISHSTPNHYVSVGDTARSAGQNLSINGSSLKDGITGIPIHLSTTADLNSLTGEISFDSSLLKGVALEKGLDLPEDWIINHSVSSPGVLTYTVSGQTSITGNLQDSLRFVGQVDSSASNSYGTTSLIQARVVDSSDKQILFKSDPGLLVNAYSGDTTGNGTHSSLDASRVQRVVVGLDTGFDAYDDINPILIGDTTGNGSLSSLDASRIQQEVVGLPVDSFPGIPVV